MNRPHAIERSPEKRAMSRRLGAAALVFACVGCRSLFWQPADYRQDIESQLPDHIESTVGKLDSTHTPRYGPDLVRFGAAPEDPRAAAPVAPVASDTPRDAPAPEEGER